MTASRAKREPSPAPGRVAAGALLLLAAGAGALLWRAHVAMSPWIVSALRSHLSIRCGAILLVGAAGLAALGRAMGRMAGRPGVLLTADQQGVAMLEFVLLFPVAMTIVLIMVQSALLMTGNLMVHYAAFAAARSAVTWIPRDLSDASDEPPNVVIPDGEKARRITEAAVLALTPIAAEAPAPAVDCPAERVATRVYEAFNGGAALPSGWSRQYRARYAYARDDRRTWIELSAPTWTPGAGDDAQDGRLDGVYDNGTPYRSYGPREDVRVTVRHMFTLSVPYANRIFGEPLDGAPGRYATEIAAGYTLVNQGRWDDVVVEVEPGTDSEPLLPH